MLKFSFTLPQPADMEALSDLMKMSMHFIDRVASKKLSVQVCVMYSSVTSLCGMRVNR